MTKSFFVRKNIYKLAALALFLSVAITSVFGPTEVAGGATTTSSMNETAATSLPAAFMGNPQNPCNPCGKKAPNPCNPCGGKMKATGRVYQDAANYRSWVKLIEPQMSEAHGGKYVVAYANPSADDAIKSDRYPFKSGAKFIKEGYEDAGGHPGELTTLWVMEKRGNDWYYAMTDPTGHIQMEGMSKQAQHCASCHAGAKKTDYVFTAMQLKGESSGKMPTNPCNPCNPCAKKKGQNPCNPCGKKRP
ncbi:MAG: cytochrome P460 family protein [Acidobacteria bacterium]|nr:cytochrome P460 family protein [Acidobacteriota bacterium]